MKIIVLNGSPKGELSVTMQYVAYLAKIYPQHEFSIVNVAQKIKRLENDRAAFDEIIAQVRAAAAVLWGFPLYILLVHAHYKRFIELISERGVQDAFAGKYAAALSTSIHFFDHTAHNYIHAICDDLGMRFLGSFSPDMTDLLKEEGRRQLVQFGQQFLDGVEKQVLTQRRYLPLVYRDFAYQPGPTTRPVPTAEKKVVILHDTNDPSSNLAGMVQRCRATFSGEVTMVNIRELQIKGSCLGCLQCGGNYHCAYEGKDEYIEFYKNTVMTADVLVYAGSMVDRYLSARWKMFFDRIFFNTHTPVLQGKQVALLVSGPFSQVPNLMEIMEGFFQFQGATLVGVVSDENGESADIDRLIDQLAARLLENARIGCTRPQTFLGVGGMKIFRDDVYSRLRFVFPADHRAYQRLGFYQTFPQRDLQSALLNTFVAPIINLPPIRRKFNTMIKPQMVRPLQMVVEKV
ncbi:MAG TPA: NAD(P)H-dependent oxidoreductase [Anaerolineaceae bacterium]|nr:NAD(P)H-dependent oxidoreductase [Anaerolineaceae bacterium]